MAHAFWRLAFIIITHVTITTVHFVAQLTTFDVWPLAWMRGTSILTVLVIWAVLVFATHKTIFLYPGRACILAPHNQQLYFDNYIHDKRLGWLTFGKTPIRNIYWTVIRRDGRRISYTKETPTLFGFIIGVLHTFPTHGKRTYIDVNVKGLPRIQYIVNIQITNKHYSTCNFHEDFGKKVEQHLLEKWMSQSKELCMLSKRLHKTKVLNNLSRPSGVVVTIKNIILEGKK